MHIPTVLPALHDIHTGEPFPEAAWKDAWILLFFFNKDCLGCIGRGLPLARYFQHMYPEVKVAGIHANFPSATYSDSDLRELYEAQLLNFPVYQDEGAVAYKAFEAEGTPHWVFIGPGGEWLNSVFGSQENAQNRVYYQLAEVFGERD